MIGIGTCDNGKIQYADYKSAKKQVASMRNDHIKREYGVYKCEHCGCFHIRTVSKVLKKRIRLEKRINKYPVKIDPKNKRFSPAINPKTFTGDSPERASFKLIDNRTANFLKQLINKSQ